jgi:NAD(P)-dependent dehydrogenase (short-subunit alcohol dehydrogenase family)
MSDSPLDITGRVAVVVGGTSGLGRKLAVGLAEAGASVVATGRRADMVAEVCAEIRTAGGDTLEQTADVADRASLDALREAVLAKFGRVDILLNAAGRSLKKPAEEVQEDEWASVLDTNLSGMFRACQAFFEPLKASGRGRIVNISSMASFVGFHNVTAYDASKAGVMGLTRSLGIDWCRHGINVNAIAPGVFKTELNTAFLEGTDRGREMLMRTPMARFGRAEELIGAAILLASDAASFITGQTIIVDGGYLASGVNS